MKKGESAAGLLLGDSSFASDLKKSMKNIEVASDRLNQNMEAAKHNILFRGYFKKKEKELKKAKEDSLSKAARKR
jgi:phospholipid/cholesterol/gamma-HCH transport system substrate-binding protein